MRSDATVRLIVGPVGSGKSTVCCMEIFRRCAEMPVGKDGFRRSRWLVVRNTRTQLKSTTLKTWLVWFPDGLAGRWKESEMTFYLSVGDIRAEILFLPLDTPDDQRRLLSLEVTGVFINEAREVHPELIVAARTRMPRYPSKAQLPNDPRTGKPVEYWHGLIMDTNPPSEDSWLYDQFEVKKPTGWEIYRQPSGLSPRAENRENLGATYYEDMMSGATEDFIRVHVHGEYGRSLLGRAVYEKTFQRDYHVAKTPLLHIEFANYPILIGMDFGRTPAAVFGQKNARGQLLVLDALYEENMGLQKFLREHVRPLVFRRFPANRIVVIGDPAGWARSQYTEHNAEDILRDEGFTAVRAPTNDPELRIQCVERALASNSSGEPGLLIDPRCKHLIQGLYGGYKYRRKQDGSYEVQPQKDEFSHDCFAAGTWVRTPAGDRPIEDLRAGDYVSTPVGPRRVTHAAVKPAAMVWQYELSDGRVLVSTPEHPVATPDGWVRIDDLQYSDILFGVHNEPEAAQWVGNHEPWSTTGYASRSAPLGGISCAGHGRGDRGTSTGTFGPSTTGLLRRAITSITSTTTQLTIGSRTLSFCLPASISAATLSCGSLRTQSGTSRSWPRPEKLQKHGTPATPAASGTESTRFGLQPRSGQFGSSASDAVASTTGTKGTASAGSALRRAKAWIEKLLAWTTRIGSAFRAAAPSRPTSTEKPRPAPRIVGRQPSPPRDVYAIRVEGAHCFYAEGILVSNCDAMQYLCLGAEQGVSGVNMGQRREIRQVAASGWT